MAAISILASAARITTTTSEAFTWSQPKAYIVLDVTAIAASPAIILYLEIYDPVSTKWVVISGTAFTAVVATGTYTYLISDTSFAPTGVTATRQAYMTDVMRIRVDHADADSITYSVSMLEVLSRFPAVL